MDDITFQLDTDSDNVSETNSARNCCTKGPHTMLNLDQNKRCKCLLTHNDDIAAYYVRQLQEAEQSLCHKNLLIAMLQEQLRKFEKLYKKNLDETQNMRYKYFTATRELNNMRKIFRKYEEENRKLSEEKKENYTNMRKYSEKEMEELQNEANKWKQLYEEILSKIESMEKNTAQMKQLLAEKEEELEMMEQKTNIVCQDAYEFSSKGKTLSYDDLKEHYNNIKSVLKQQTEKLDLIFDTLNSDFKKQSDEIRDILSTTQGDIIEISIEAKKLRKTSKSMDEMSVEQLWSENSALRNEIEITKSGSIEFANLEKNICCPLENYNAVLNELNRCRSELNSLQHENNVLRNDLLNLKQLIEENETMKLNNGLKQTVENEVVSKGVITDITENYKDTQIELLEDEIKLKNNEIYRFTNENEQKELEHKKIIDELGEVIEQKGFEIDGLMDENELKQLQQKSIIDELTAKTNDMKRDYDNLLDKNIDINKNLSNALLVSKNKDAEIRTLHDDISELEKQLETCDIRNNKALQELTSFKHKVDDQETLIREFKCENEELHEKVDFLEINLMDLQTQLEELQALADSKSDSVNVYESELRIKIDESNKLRTLSNDLELTILSLDDEHKMKEKEFHEQLEENKKALADVTDEHDKLKVIMKNYEYDTQKKIEQMDEELDKITNEALDLKNSLNELTAKLCYHESSGEENKTKIKELENECLAQKDKNAFLERKLAEKEELEEILNTVEEKLKTAEKELERKNIQLQENSNNHTLQNEHDKCIKQINDLENLVHLLSNENDNLKMNLDNLVQTLESKINEVDLYNDCKDCDCSSLPQIEHDAKSIQTNTKQFNEKATVCENFSTTNNYKVCSTQQSLNTYVNSMDLNKPDIYVKQRNLESEELEIKRRYLLNRIYSIDNKLNCIELNSLKATSSRSLPDIHLENFSISKQANNKKVPASDQCKHKFDGVLTLFETCKDHSSSCDCSYSDIKDYNKDKEKWQKSFKIVESMRKEMEHVNIDWISTSTITDNSSDNCFCLKERVVNLQDQLSVTAQIEKEVEKLEKHLSKQHTQTLAKIAKHRTGTNPCYTPKTEKRQAILSELHAVHGALKKKNKEEKTLRSQCECLKEQIRKKQMASNSEHSTSSNMLNSFDFLPQPFIKVDYPCSAQCTALPNSLIINTSVDNANQIKKKNMEVRLTK